MKPKLKATGDVEVDIIYAHRRSTDHRQELERSASCGCFYCLAMYPHTAIVEWIDEEQTALCPKCGIDSVIGSASEFPIEAGFLKRMKGHWFG